MECLVDDTANCNVPTLCPKCGDDISSNSLQLQQQASPCSTYVNPVIFDRMSVSTTICSEDNRQGNTNNNMPDFTSTDHDMNSPFHGVSNTNIPNSSCSRCSNPAYSTSVTHQITSFPVDSTSNITNLTHTAHRPRSSLPCACPLQQPNVQTAVNRPRSNSSPQRIESIQCRNCFVHLNTGVHMPDKPPCRQWQPDKQGGGRLSLESYLIPDPEARADLERRLKAYSRAASLEHSSEHITDGSRNLDLKGDVSDTEHASGPSFSSCTQLSPQSFPFNLNMCQDDNSNSKNSHSDRVDNASTPTLPCFVVTGISGEESVLSLSGDMDAGSPISSLLLRGSPYPRHSKNSNIPPFSPSPCSSRPVSRPDSPVLINAPSQQTISTSSLQKSVNNSLGGLSVGSTGDSFTRAGSPSRRRHKVKTGQGTWSRHQLLAQLHCQPVEDQDNDEFEDTLSDDIISSLEFFNYTIHEVLGTGISSTVRRVTEKTTGAEYAVKIIDISGEKGESDQVEQIKRDTFREIRILRMCNGHPNIIELRDVFETPTFIFLVFEICKKGELFDYLTSVISLSEKRTRIFMRQLLQAVDFFHQQNIVHRDLKPENILLDDNLNIKVSDFGFATVLEKGEELSELCGTPGYLAPEVLAHSMYENVSGYGKEVDMWACGVIMYTLLCGAPPFWHRRQMMMLRAIMSADYTFNTPEWDDITDAPKNLIQKLLVVNPQQRLTARQALAHPFFCGQETINLNWSLLQIVEDKKFQGKKKFRVGAHCIIFYLRLGHTAKHPPPILVSTVRENPYSIKIMRKAIDASAFSMYKHWVKRVENQNRAAMFEHTLRDDWRRGNLTMLPEDKNRPRI